MTPSLFKHALATAGMSQNALAAALGLSQTAVNRWAATGVPEARVPAVLALLAAAQPAVKTPDQVRRFRSWDGLTEMNRKKVHELPLGARVWEYLWPGHPFVGKNPGYSVSGPQWHERMRSQVRGPNTFLPLQHGRLVLPGDATPEMFATVYKATSEQARRDAARVALAYAQFPDTDAGSYDGAGDFANAMPVQEIAPRYDWEDIDDPNEPGYADTPSPFRTL